MNYRQKECFNVIRFPAGFVEEDRGLKECCPTYLALAHPSDSDNYKNDIRGIAIKISDVSDTVTFVIEKCGDPAVTGNLTLLGEVPVFPQDNLVIGYMFDWQQYLNTYGAGTYKISIEFTISGVTGGYPEGLYVLKPFSIGTARETVRMYTSFGSFSNKTNIDFTYSNFEDSIRVRGTFGERQPETETNKLITTGRKVQKIKYENVNAYSLKTYPLNAYETRRIINEHFLEGDEILMSDHNRWNHDYFIFDKPVDYISSELDYKRGNRRASINAEFGDTTKRDISYYNRP